MTFGERLKEVRMDNKLNQNEFAERINTSRAHISNLETGKKSASSALIKLICFEFFVNEEWMVNGIGNKYCNATIDMVNLGASARGQKPLNEDGYEMAAAINIAAKLFHIYPRIIRASVTIDQFLDCFLNDDFCDAICALIRVSRNADVDPVPYNLFMAMFKAIQKTVPSSITDEQANAMINAFKREPLAIYLNERYNDVNIEQDLL